MGLTFLFFQCGYYNSSGVQYTTCKYSFYMLHIYRYYRSIGVIKFLEMLCVFFLN